MDKNQATLTALSFYKTNNYRVKNLYVIPPLLRNDILNIDTSTGDYFVGYILNAGYAEDIKKWQRNNKDITLKVFWDKKQDEKINDKLSFHAINDSKFIELMSNCKGYFCTAGFESICEAYYLGKPVLLNPVKNHYEQECNAHDAVRSGAGIIDRNFNISKLIDFIPKYHSNTEFKHWINSSELKFLEILTK